MWLICPQEPSIPGVETKLYGENSRKYEPASQEIFYLTECGIPYDEAGFPLPPIAAAELVARRAGLRRANT